MPQSQELKEYLTDATTADDCGVMSLGHSPCKQAIQAFSLPILRLGPPQDFIQPNIPNLKSSGSFYHDDEHNLSAHCLLIRSQLHGQSVSLEAGSKITSALFRVGGYCKVDIC